MIRSYVFSEGKLIGENVDTDALKIIRADKGIHIWVDLAEPTPQESKLILEEVFNFHPLAIEDCLAVSHLPKIEDYDDYLFLVMHAVDFSRKDKFVTSEIDFFLGKEFLVTHHTTPIRSVQSVIDRLQKNSLQIARMPDRLLHTLIDSLVDNYQPAISELTYEIQELEDHLFSEQKGSQKNYMSEFLTIKKDVVSLRQIVRPQREVINRIVHNEFKIIRATLTPYFRDVYDHLYRIEESASNHNDHLMLSMDLFLNKASNETNEVIKALTVVTVYTTPATLIASWYGMNFAHMPELQTHYGYLYAILLTIVTTALLVFWFRKKL
jgi:magnesium transporter